MRIVGVAVHPDDETSDGTMTGLTGPTGEFSVCMLTAHRLETLGQLDGATSTRSSRAVSGER